MRRVMIDSWLAIGASRWELVVMKFAKVAGLKIWENNGSIFLASEQEPQRARRHQSVESAELDIAHFQANGVLPRSAENLN